MKILIIGYCNLADGFLYGSNEFKKKGHSVYFFPFYDWKNDNFNNCDVFFNKIKNTIFDLNIWWYSDCCVKFINMFGTQCKKYNILCKKNIIYNWDPVLYHSQKIEFWKNKIQSNKELIESGLCSEYYCVTPEQITDIGGIYNPSGFSRELVMNELFTNNSNNNNNNNNNNNTKNNSVLQHHINNITYEEFNKNKNYNCDLSIVITNLYIDENFSPTMYQLGNRKKIIDYFYERRDKFKIHLYGSEFLNKMYPDIYKGFAKYEECVKIFHNSKVNICYNISSFLNKNKMDYYSERLPQILGSGGLLISDCDYYCLQNNVHYIKITNDDFEYLESVILNSDKYDDIRKNGWNKAWKTMTWEKWSDIILANQK